MDLSHCQRLVIKVGSALLVDADGRLNRSWLASLTADIAQLVAAGKDVLVVSSGAIAIGAQILGINRRRARLAQLQAAAAAGQVQLVHTYQELMADHNLKVAQILLTPDDTENRRRFLNARATLTKLLESHVVPIINENDTVATEEIRYGDNDRLAARVAQLVMADALILLSDVEGLYSADPNTDSTAAFVEEVEEVTDEVFSMAGATASEVGSGGMLTKLQAAQIATHAGCATIIAAGTISHPIDRLLAGGKHTVFRANRTPAAARQQWLAGLLEVGGSVHVDAGAATALRSGKSLLPVGVIAVNDAFKRGDVVSILDADGVEIGRGLAEYSGAEAKRLLGCQSDDIERLLGYRGRPVIVHTDELVLFEHD